jgi:beta-glucosidase
LYFPAFEYAVKNAKPAMVMCAYNKINGTYCSSNKWLLTDVLRREWGFDGMVVTDWGAMRDRAEGFKSGCDWAMPGGSNHLQRHSMEAYNAGRLSEAEINLCADRILTRVFASERARKNIKPVDYNAHHALARRAASESAVLLKNDGDILPLKTNRVALFGVMAKEPRYQGSGSSHINPARLTNLCGAAPSWTYSEGFDIKLARESDAAVIVTGLPDNYESEGFDREHMRMPEEQINLIEAVSAANLNTVVVLISGSPVEMPWLDKVKAVLYMGLPGQAGGEAALDVLTGAVNPSGKLAETWPLRYEDVPSAGCFGVPHRDAQYREGVFAGYRHYESAKTDVRFPFGFGLSYTKFEYNDLRVEGSTVTVNVKNTGITAGAEVVQLYISPPVGSIGRPVKELKGFEKIFLQPGERCDVTFELCDRCFAVWHKVWRVPGGAYGLHIGSSVKDIRLSQAYDAAGEAFSLPAKGRKDWPAVSAEPRKGEYTLESTIAEMARTSLAARLIKYFMARSIAKANGGRNTTAYKMAYASAVDCALFGIIQTSGGALPENVAMGILEMANGHVLRGMKMMLSKKQKD